MDVCDIGFYCPLKSANQLPCPTNSGTLLAASTSISDCICNAGYFGSNGTCFACSTLFNCPRGSLEPTPLPLISSITLNEATSTYVNQAISSPAIEFTTDFGVPTETPEPKHVNTYGNVVTGNPGAIVGIAITVIAALGGGVFAISKARRRPRHAMEPEKQTIILPVDQSDSDQAQIPLISLSDTGKSDQSFLTRITTPVTVKQAYTNLADEEMQQGSPVKSRQAPRHAPQKHHDNNLRQDASLR
jgi:hypothetical protein